MNQFVPDRIGSTGEKLDIKNPTLFSMFVSPAIVSEFERRPGADLVTDIYERGLGQQTEQFPASSPIYSRSGEQDNSHPRGAQQVSRDCGPRDND